MNQPATKRLSRLRVASIAAAVLLLFAALAFLGHRLATNDALATLTEFSGQTERDTKATLEQWRRAAPGDDFSAGDGARTREGSVAHFRLSGGARLKLEPSSQIRFQRGGQPGRVKVDVDVGEARLESGQTLTIDSEFGPIVLDEKSAVTLSRTGSRLNVSVDLGSISVSDRTLAAGQSVDLELGGLVLDVALPPTAEAEAEPSTVPSEVAPAPTVVPRLGDGVPNAELVVDAGESFVVHDPKPPTAVGFRVSALCSGPARLTSASKSTEGSGQLNLSFAKGNHGYEVRCLDAPEVVRARGTVKVLHDSGTARLPAFAPSASVAADGRTYTVLYQHRLPKVTVSWPAAPQATTYTLKIGSRSIATSKPYYTFSTLAKGRHSIVFSAQTTPTRQSRTTTIDVVHDSQAPTARVSESPLDDSEGVRLSGQTLPGWNVSIGDRPVEVDPQQKFSIEVAPDDTVPITFSHPSRDTHYYLRRPKAAP